AAHHRLEIDEARIASAERLRQRQERRLVVHAEPAREHAIAAERDGEVAGIGRVGHGRAPSVMPVTPAPSRELMPCPNQTSVVTGSPAFAGDDSCESLERIALELAAVEGG